MAGSKKVEFLENLVAPAIEALGCELWGIEYLPQGKHSILRIYIDSEDGVNVDDCAAVSRQVSAVLDVEDPISGAYSLEVSSPGMDRPLFTLEQFGDYLQEDITVKLTAAIDNKRKFKGLLTEIEGDQLTFVVDGESLSVPYSFIDKANVVPKFD